MANSILGRNVQPNPTPNPNNQDMLQQFMQFKNTFRGDPKQMVMNMLANGQITNPQLQQVMQMARQFQGLLK
jgi:hypothetical protein